MKKQNIPPADEMDSPNWSSIDKASFLEGLQPLNGNPPLHSTAMDEDLNTTGEEQVDEGRAGKKEIPKKTNNKQRGATAKRKENGGATREKEPDVKRQKRTNKEVKTSPRKVTAKEGTAGKKSSVLRQSGQPLVGKKPSRRKSAVQTSEPRSVKSASKNSHNNPSQEQSDSEQTNRMNRMPLSSDEEGDEDTSWKPSPKKTSLRLTGKSSTENSGSSEEESTDTETKRRRRPAAREQTEFDVVLDAFLQFCDKYRESVESQQVQKSISILSKNVKAQLNEKISSSKEFKALKRENTKMCSSIRKNTQRLLDRKHEMLRTQNEISQLEMEKGQLQRRLTLLRRGQSFLHDIRELNQRYLDHRRQNPHQKETYGASSLPALLLQTRYMKNVEKVLPQLKGQNNMTKTKTGTKK
ncbi:unnamed protein product [Ophioblennius macclurei]